MRATPAEGLARERRSAGPQAVRAPPAPTRASGARARAWRCNRACCRATTRSSPSRPHRARRGRHRARLGRDLRRWSRAAAARSRRATRPTCRSSTRRADRPRPRDPLPGAAFVHRRGRARTAGARRAGGAAAAALPTLPRSRQPRSGLRLAEPGEFTERAFLNDKLDLAQAEAVADLIDASTEAAARSAGRSLSGAFSAEVNALRERLVELRMLVEATLDFPDEEIDFLREGRCARPPAARRRSASTRCSSARARARCCAKASRSCSPASRTSARARC